MAKFFASKSPDISDREKKNMERARKIASQGMVLLSNNGALPLGETGNIALFGNGGRKTVKGGTGSGDVNSRFVVNVEQGLEEAGFTVTTKGWLDRYDTAVEEAKAAYLEGHEGDGLYANIPDDVFRDRLSIHVVDLSRFTETVEAVKALPAHQREAVHLFYHEGYTAAEIGAMLGRREATVRSDLRRGRARLKEILKEAYDFEEGV
mgnify:CR=1 FL=1